MKIENSRLRAILPRINKPARYIGGETNLIVKSDARVRFLFAFPDLYEIGMSYVGLGILYEAINREEGLSCERTFAPAGDMKAEMLTAAIPLYALESKDAAADFDFIGFTLQYEMSFTNVLDMIDLAGLPIQAELRDDEMPIITAGGPCAYNPEPLAKFIDLFVVGDGEYANVELMRLYEKMKEDDSYTKRDFLRRACQIQGVYVPRFYDVSYNDDGTVAKYVANDDAAPKRVVRALIDDIEDLPYPQKPLVPLIGVVHDRAVVETFRGCTRGCRFCQAGIIYRPVRERSRSKITDLATQQISATGHDELSLLSLSTSDYSEFEELATGLMQDCKEKNVSLSLPSLRLDSFSFKVLEEIQGYRKSGLTFAPEAGTQRLRDIINKNITDGDIYDALSQAIDLGWTRIKLYFMMGLPRETHEDLAGIAEIAKNIMHLAREKGAKGRFTISVSVSNFVPKPHTPFQWRAQDTRESFVEKHNYLSGLFHIKGVDFNYHDSPVSYLEAVIARGDRKVADLIEKAWKNGCTFDSWSELFNEAGWEKAFQETGIDGTFYANRERPHEEILPWDIIDPGITKKFLIDEDKKADLASVTPDCRISCQNCGINRFAKCKWGGVNA